MSGAIEQTSSSLGTSPSEDPDGRAALDRARDYLLSLQDPRGYWQGELETNVTIDAEDMLLRRFLGIRELNVTNRSAAWIRSQQRSDGTSSNFEGGTADLSTTIEAYIALRLAGDQPGDEHMLAAREFVHDAGGLEAARVFTHIWLAMFGAWSWDHVPALLPEQILLPAWVPLNIYDFACWTRQTVVALTVVLSLRPVRPLPFALPELEGDDPWSPPSGTTVLARGMSALDRVLRFYQRRPIAVLRRIALARAGNWIVDRQEADGSWGGIQPPWVYSLIALHLLGYERGHTVIERGLAGMETYTIDDAGGRRLEACQSPIWDTCLALVALADAGVPGDHEAVLRGADWLIDEQILGRGDWAVRRAHLAPGGWAFEFANANYPNVDDTSEVVMALRTVEHPDPVRVEAAIDRGVAWLEGRRGEEAIRRAVRWLEEHQNDDGGWGEDCRSYDDDAWIGRGESTPSQTAWALLALDAAGERSESVQCGAAWLLANQREDGGWDEPHHTGTGFPSDFYIKYHLYRLIFPVMALGRCMR